MKSQQILSFFIIAIIMLYGAYNIDVCIKIIQENKEYKLGMMLIILNIALIILGLGVAWIVRWTN